MQYNNVYAPVSSLHVPMNNSAYSNSACHMQYHYQYYNQLTIENNNIAYAPGGREKTYTCPMCNGTGYINDYGNGELITANWWRQETGNTGDGTYCDGVNAYHDQCDSEWSDGGWTYHHDYKRVCPQCNGVGTVTSKRRPSTLSGWVQWTGESWSHAYEDLDGDGHCDEHYWHKLVPIGNDICLILFVCIYCIIIKFKHARRCQNKIKHIRQ